MKKLVMFSFFAVLSAVTETKLDLSDKKVAQKTEYIPYYMKPHINKACEDCGDCSGENKNTKLFTETVIRLATQKIQSKQA